MKSYVWLICCTVATALLGKSSGHDPNIPLVSVTQGQMRGSFMTAQNGRRFAAFRGIPYAQPPVGQLRFQDPVAASAWDGVLDASREGPKCIQYDPMIKAILGVEDCLMVNVYTADVNAEVAKPVMVFIHGGAFIIGSGNGEDDVYGPKLLMDRDIVLVTINYRLGPFGFLSTEDAEAPGNYGLLDQSLALRWVRENIGAFGGDADSVTIFGESAGAASVEYQILSPRSQGLFHGAISQSGSTSCFWSFFEDIGQRTRTLAGFLQCPVDSSRHILDCLRAKSAVEILDMRQKFQVPPLMGLFPIIFGPRVDTERESPFLPAHPQSLLESSSFNHVPYITGFNRNEGVTYLGFLLANDGEGIKAVEKDPLTMFTVLLGLDAVENRAEIITEVTKLLDMKTPFDRQLSTLDEIFSDVLMFKCVDQSVNLFAKFNQYPVYHYHYAYRGTISTTASAGVTMDLGVSHADELLLMFASDFFSGVITDDDRRVSTLLLDLWTSFATDRVPQSDLTASPWVPLDKDGRGYLNIDVSGAVMSSEDLPYRSRLPFWNGLLNVSVEHEANAPDKDEL